MRLVFNERKTAQAAAHLLKLHGGTMSYMVLIKLLYFADKEALIHTGYSITGDQMLSMKNGPVLSAVLDLVHMGRPDEATAWFEYVSENQGYDVSLVRDTPEADELSPATRRNTATHSGFNSKPILRQKSAPPPSSSPSW